MSFNALWKWVSFNRSFYFITFEWSKRAHDSHTKEWNWLSIAAYVLNIFNFYFTCAINVCELIRCVRTAHFLCSTFISLFTIASLRVRICEHFSIYICCWHSFPWFLFWAHKSFVIFFIYCAPVRVRGRLTKRGNELYVNAGQCHFVVFYM